MDIFEKILSDAQDEQDRQTSIDRLNADPCFQAAMAEARAQRQPLDRKTLAKLTVGLPTFFGADHVWETINHSISQDAVDLVTFENHGIRLITPTYAAYEVGIDFGDDFSEEDELFEPVGWQEEDEEGFFSSEEESDSPLIMPSPNLDEKGLRHFVEEHDGRWIILPPDGLHIVYQGEMVQGEPLIYPDIAEFESGMSGSLGYLINIQQEIMSALGLE